MVRSADKSLAFGIRPARATAPIPTAVDRVARKAAVAADRETARIKDAAQGGTGRGSSSR